MSLGLNKQVKLSEAAAAQLLLELCVKLGLCLPPKQYSRLSKNPPATIERFTRTVYLVEGLAPTLESDLYKAVRGCFATAFERYAAQVANTETERLPYTSTTSPDPK